MSIAITSGAKKEDSAGMGLLQSGFQGLIGLAKKKKDDTPQQPNQNDGGGPASRRMSSMSTTMYRE